MFLTPDLDRDDLWEEADSGLKQYLRENQKIAGLLLDTPAEQLTPADQFMRAMLLEEEGDFEESRRLEALANKGLYTPAYLRCWQSQVDALLARLESSQHPIIDLASGRGYLVEQLCLAGDNPIVCSDFSPRVLRRNRRWLGERGWADRVSLLAFDARRTPFKDKAVNTLTTNLGFANIQKPAGLFKELRRIISGKLLAINFFFPEGDGNAELIEQAGLARGLYRAKLEADLQAAGFRVTLANRCVSAAKPTPPGEILEGAMVDRLPVEETELEWGLIVAK